MIELIAAAVSGAVVGGVTMRLAWRQTINDVIYKWRGLASDALYKAEVLSDTLTALRSNCFIPDERGVKVAYSKASVARRVKAETPRTDKV